MERTLDDIEGKFAVVAPEEGVSLATLGAFIDPMVNRDAWNGNNRAAYWHMEYPLASENARALDDTRVFAPMSGAEPIPPGAGISFADMVRTLNPEASNAAWGEGGGTPMQSERGYTGGDAGVAPDLLRMIPRSAGPDVWDDRHGAEGTSPWYLGGALVSESRAPFVPPGVEGPPGMPSHLAQPDPLPRVAEDVAKAVPSALAKGTIGLAGTPGDVGNLWFRAGYALTDLLEEKLGLPKGWAAETKKLIEANRRNSPMASLPASPDIRARVEDVTGPLYEPKTTVGKYVGAAVEGIPGAAGGASFVGNLLKFGIMPGLAAEAAGQATEGSAWEPWERLGTAVAAGGAAAAMPSRRPVAQAGRTPQEQHMKMGDDLAQTHSPPDRPARSFESDFPNGGRANASGFLTRSIEGVPLVAIYVAGRRKAGGPDVPLAPAEVEAVIGQLTGKPIREVRALTHAENTIGGYNPKTRDVWALDVLENATRARVLEHELGHRIDHMTRYVLQDAARAKVMRQELDTLYSRLGTGVDRAADDLHTPGSRGYKEPLHASELVAEALRAYMSNPNYMKTVAPETAKFIRQTVNGHPALRDVIQFNSMGALLPIGGAAALGIGAAGSQGDFGGRADNEL